MTTPSEDGFDRTARRLHAQSLEALSPRVQAQLAQRRRGVSSTPARRAPWTWATAAASVCVLVVALQVRVPMDTPAGAAPAPVAAVQESAPDPGGMLAEDPEFYAWLASSESLALIEE
jgi:hypothetical protein